MSQNIAQLNSPRYEVYEKQDDGQWGEPKRFVTQTEIGTHYGITRHICLNLIRGHNSPHADKIKVVKIICEKVSRPVGGIQTFNRYTLSKLENGLWSDPIPYRTMKELAKDLNTHAQTLTKVLKESNIYKDIYKIESVESETVDEREKRRLEKLKIWQEKKDKRIELREKVKELREQKAKAYAELQEKKKIIRTMNESISEDRQNVVKLVDTIRALKTTPI